MPRRAALTLNRDAIIYTLIDFESLAHLIPLFKTWTGSASTQYIESFKLKEDRLGRLCVRGVAKLLLASVEKKNKPSNYEIQKRESGEVFSPQSSLSLSFSHTSTHAAVALSNKKCGIDIENNSRSIDRENISKHFFSNQEHQQVLKDRDTFFRIWTAKEAFLKYEGTGIDRPLKDIRISMNEVQYQNEVVDLYTQVKIESHDTIILSIVGAHNCREISILELLEINLLS